MADLPIADGEARRLADDPAPPAPDEHASRTGVSTQVLPLLEERMAVSKRRRRVGRVRVSTRTEVIEAIATVDLDRYSVEVTRVPLGHVVDAVPAARAEGDTTVVPVVEERFVVIKQLVLVEELRIRHVLEREAVSEPVTLRRQHVVVERLPANGEDAGDDLPSSK